MPHNPQDLDELVSLARRFADRRLYDEAGELFLLALKLDPKNLGLQLALAQVRKLQKQARGGSLRGPREAAREEMRRNAIDAAHFLGLAHLYAEKGEDARALECLEVARAKDLSHPGHHKLAGRIYARAKEWDAAAVQLGQAQRFNPFDREVVELLGQVHYERRQFEEALTASIDAFLLAPADEPERAAALKRRIRTLKQILSWDSSRLVELFHERQEAIHVAFERLEWRRERFFAEEAWSEAEGPVPARQPRGGRIDIANRLRQLDSLSHLTDEQVFKLTQVLHEERAERGVKIFANGSSGSDFYLLEQGEISIQRPTPYGTFTLALLKPGALFGEVNYLSRGLRSGDALAAQPSQLLRFDAQELERLIDGWKELGVQVYWALWHGLAGKLRATNDQLRTFFSADTQPENFVRLRRGLAAVAGSVQVDSSDKIRVFREQGLSTKELISLATFSRERRYPDGTHLFQEGDEGREMYVVLEGKVLISKFIPGAGEEALAVLERGDFFGEMSLIDGELRSADARAHGGPLTVLALDQGAIQEMLVLDPQAALEFLQLLCRLVAKRLREIDEKVIGWRILAGDHSTTLSA